MKRLWVVITNVLIMTAMIVFVVIYSTTEAKANIQRQVVHFENTTITMEHVTENYLEGEQRICDVWAHYINSEEMSMEEAIDYIRTSHALSTAGAHIVYSDTRKGFSTRPLIEDETRYDVSYEHSDYDDFMSDLSWIKTSGPEATKTLINVTHAFSTKTVADQVIAFCNIVNLKESGTPRQAVLLRILPISELKTKWKFQHEAFEKAEYAIIDANGNYVIKEYSYKNDNFFNFYSDFNSTNYAALDALKIKVTTTQGSFRMGNSHYVECIVAHTPFDDVEGLSWTILNMMEVSYLNVNTQNWQLIGFVSVGLVLLFIFDAVVMAYFNKRLRITTKEAESANKAKTNFLSTMSHDIRTPMNAIIGLTTISEKNLDDKKMVGENLRKISLASNHLLTLINDILDISKVESGKLNLVPQTFSIVETVENLMNLSQPTIKAKNIEFNFRVSRMDKEYLYADQLRINQIYINLLSNAIKYTEPGGRVSVDMMEEESPKPGCVRLAYKVEDTGIGMSPEYMANMYQPFSRQTDSRVNKIQGTGLGLAITKRMVDLMEGTIECQSEQGKGTTFVVTLDLPIAEHQVGDLKLEPMDVLIADDDEILLQTASDTLESLGLHVDKASNGQQALEMIKDRHEKGNDYRVVIVDLKMPDLDGVETIRRIHSEIDSNIPILLVSAYDWSDIDEEAKKVGVNGFLSKPLFRSTLYEKLNEILGNEVQVSEQENEYADLEGLNILVAEDNEINWEIISTLLSMYGITTERAENGRIAVEKMKAAKDGQYTLVFMDIQMPEMNGLDATRAIRQLENEYASKVPIIAMTADAFAENIAECLDAGMNGHIAKPIDIKLVLKEIRRIKEESKQ